MRRAIVFSGGGARGAYEAGVLRFLLDDLPRRLGRPVSFDLVSGTSVGAIHACWTTATAHLPPGRGETLASIWRRFRLDEMLPLTAMDVLRVPRRLLGLRRLGETLRSGEPPDRLYGALRTDALERIVMRDIPWHHLRRNLREGRVEATCVAATQIATGHAVVFTETAEGTAPQWTRDPTVIPRAVHLGPVHALASAAIPMLFPAVRVGDTYYADGGLRLNTPLSPVVRLGATRVLVIALRSAPAIAGESALRDARIESYGSPAFLFGKVLNALLLDHVDTDLQRLRLMNEILRTGESAYGPEFLDRINDVARRERGLELRLIEPVVLRPSVDLGLLAGEVLARKRTDGELSPLLRLFLGALSGGGERFESDLLSYLLFDAEFTRPVIELGYDDALANEDELARFFSDEPMETA